MRKILFIIALMGNILHAQVPRVCITPPKDLNRPEPLKAFGQLAKLWPKDTFYVYFMDGHEYKNLFKKVMYHAKKWEKYSDIKFLRTNAREKSDIRITFGAGGSWSYVGVDNRFIPKEEPTMQLGWVIESIGDSKELTRVIVHEFGHFIGLEHEHQSPGSSIKWNRPQVYIDYAKMGWSKNDVDHNLFEKFNWQITNYTVYDPTSIMHYPIPVEHTLDGYFVGWNKKLSRLDKNWVGNTYGR